MTTPAKIKALRFINARSYANVQFNLAPGLNVVVGESDSGKTNVVRNTRSLVENGPLDSIRRFDTPEKAVTSIELHDTEHNVFELRRTAAINECRWYGPMQQSVGYDKEEQNQNWTSIGNGTPDAYRQRLGLSPIDLSGCEADIHFSDQRDPLFVVDAPPSQIAKIVGAVSGLDVLYRAVANGDQQRRAANAQVTAQKRVLDAAQADRQQAQARVDALRPHADAVAQAEASRLAAFNTTHELQQVRRNYLAARARTKRLTDARDQLRAALDKATAAYEHAARLHALRNTLTTAAHTHRTQEDTLHAARQALEDAARRSAQVTATLGTTVVPCPTCGTRVQASTLANRP